MKGLLVNWGGHEVSFLAANEMSPFSERTMNQNKKVFFLVKTEGLSGPPQGNPLENFAGNSFRKYAVRARPRETTAKANDDSAAVTVIDSNLSVIAPVGTSPQQYPATILGQLPICL